MCRSSRRCRGRCRASRRSAAARCRRRRPLPARTTPTRRMTPYAVGHHLQQLLRVRPRQGRPGAQRAHPPDAAVDHQRRRRGRQAAGRSTSTRCCSGSRSRSASIACAASRPGRWSSRGSGFPLGDLIKRLEPTGNAKFVEFTTLLDPEQMPGQRDAVLDWPYVEGLRMDEAMHPLTLIAVGLYGKTLPNQNGAPLRLVVPWKYGFKGVKSIVKIRFTDDPAEDHLGAGRPARVRLLRQRESGGRPSALEPGHRAPHRRAQPPQDAAVQRLRRPGREPVRGHGPAHELLELRAMARRRAAALAEARAVHRRAGAAGVDGPRGRSGQRWAPTRSPRSRTCSACRRWSCCRQPGLHARPAALRLDLAGADPTRAGPVRLLLRRAALPDLRAGGPGSGRGPDRRRHRQAAVHHGRLRGAGAADAAGLHLDHRLDPAARLPALDAPPPAGLRGRRAGGDPLHLAGQDRREPAPDLRRHPGRAAADPPGVLAAERRAI